MKRKKKPTVRSVRRIPVVGLWDIKYRRLVQMGADMILFAKGSEARAWIADEPHRADMYAPVTIGHIHIEVRP